MKNRMLSAVALIGLTAGIAVMAATPDTQTKQGNKMGGMEQSERSEESKKSEQARLQSQAKITMEQARETALRRAAGNVEGSELEREHGKLVYSFDIRNAKGTITEVQVDAITGKVARVEHENAKQEADEKRREEKEHGKGAAAKP